MTLEVDQKDIIEERKKKLAGFFRKNKFCYVFSILALISFVLAFLGYVSVINSIPIVNIFSNNYLNWLYLGFSFSLSAILAYNNKFKLMFYPILLWVLWILIYVRTLNISKLKDVTTGTWTLGPDLDPFLFLRWAEYIVLHGKLMVVDMMRNVPLGFDTSEEMKLLSYSIAWFHNFLSAIGISNSVTYSAILFPVVGFTLTAIAFFLFSRKIFDNESYITSSVIALLATLLFVLIPSLLPRSIAGIPEKESIAFAFMFFTFYFFMCSYNEKKSWKAHMFGVFAGISTALGSLLWGGISLVYLIMTAVILFTFLLGKMDKTKMYSFGLWILFTFGLAFPFSSRFNLKNLIVSTSTGPLFVMFLVMLVHFYFIEKKPLSKIKYPKEIVSFVIVGIILLILATLFFGVSFISDHINDVIKNSVRPLGTTRFTLTVAENKQPYFISDWQESFGPLIRGIPIFFWMFFAGSVLLFNTMINKLRRKEKVLLTLAYLIFLFALIFSKYSPDSVFNGDSVQSFVLYFGGMLFLVISFGYIYVKKYRDRSFEAFKAMNFSYILYFVLLTMGVIAARGGVRLIIILAAIVPVVVSFLVVKTSESYLNKKNESKGLFIGIIAMILIISVAYSVYAYYASDEYTGGNYAPTSYYTLQWQKAMSWVRDNTAEDAVFAHWWDYGYWLQSIGKRATIIDGGNAIVYWDYLMGRYVLTESDEQKSLEFLYTHNATHLLIDSTDIGKYTAFSSIGSDPNYDRFSWIQSFYLDEKQSVETRDQTVYTYTGGSPIDEDIIWNNNGTSLFLPYKSAYVGAVQIPIKNDSIEQADVIFVYKNTPYRIPLRYVYYNGKLYDFKNGLEAGVFVYPRVVQGSNGQASISEKGTLLYLSKKTIHSAIARMYLFGEQSQYFRLVHSEDSPIVESLKQQKAIQGAFVDYPGVGFAGPIRIWQISYPSNIRANPDYLLTDYPSQDIKVSKAGYY